MRLDPAAFTIGFARRATPYKRPDLLFTNLERLRRIIEQVGPIQVFYLHVTALDLAEMTRIASLLRHRGGGQDVLRQVHRGDEMVLGEDSSAARSRLVVFLGQFAAELN